MKYSNILKVTKFRVSFALEYIIIGKSVMNNRWVLTMIITKTVRSLSHAFLLSDYFSQPNHFPGTLIQHQSAIYLVMPKLRKRHFVSFIYLPFVIKVLRISSPMLLYSYRLLSSYFF